MIAAGLMFCRVVIAAVFVLSAGGKALDVPAFQESVEDFRLMPKALARVAAWFFLVSEIAVVIAMAIGGRALMAGFVLAAGLLVLFSTALAVALRRKAAISCNCFGRDERRISPYDMARNALLTACSLAGVWTLTASTQSLSGSELALVILMAACFVALVTNLRDVAETLRQPFWAE